MARRAKIKITKKNTISRIASLLLVFSCLWVLFPLECCRTTLVGLHKLVTTIITAAITTYPIIIHHHHAISLCEQHRPNNTKTRRAYRPDLHSPFFFSSNTRTERIVLLRSTKFNIKNTEPPKHQQRTTLPQQLDKGIRSGEPHHTEPNPTDRTGPDRTKPC